MHEGARILVIVHHDDPFPRLRHWRWAGVLGHGNNLNPGRILVCALPYNRRSRNLPV
jgi:hypothetical protein